MEYKAPAYNPTTIDDQADKGSDPSNYPFLNYIDIVLRYLAYGTVLLLPILVLPYPGGWASYVKGIFILFITILFLTLYIVKIFFAAEISIYKNPLDLIFTLVGGSIVVSTIFSDDLRTSLMGLDYRLSSGALVMVSMLILLYVIRSQFKDHTHLANFIFVYLVGGALSVVMSVLSFASVNYLPVVRNLFVEGLITFETVDVAVAVWVVNLLVSVLASIWFGYDKQSMKANISMALGFVSAFGVVIFSVAASLPILVVSGVAVVLAVVLVYSKMSLGLKTQVGFAGMVVALLLGGVMLFQVPSFKDNLLEAGAPITQARLDGAITWNIVTSNLSQSVKAGLLGLGPDTFGIYFNIFKPTFYDNLDLSNTTFLFGSSEVLTLLGNQGVVGALLWIGAGGWLLHRAYVDYRKMLDQNNVLNLMLVLLDLVLLYIFVLSMFTYFGLMLYFVFFLLITLNVLIRSVFMPTSAESYKIKMNVLIEKIGDSSSAPLSWGLSVVTVTVGALLMLWWVGHFRAAVNAVIVESKIVSFSEKYAGEDEPEIADVKEDLAEIIDDYSKSVEASSDNYVYRRRRALLIIDYMDILVNQINQQAEADGSSAEGGQVSDEVEALQDELTNTAEIAIEEASEATKSGPNIASNWDVRGLIYSSLVGYGVTSYAEPGLEVIDSAVRLNPSNYLLYYRGTQMYLALEDVESAENVIRSGLSLNPNHVPSLLLAGEISISLEKLDQAEQLFTAVQDLLEELEVEDEQLSSYIDERLAAIADPDSLEENLDPDVLPDEDAGATDIGVEGSADVGADNTGEESADDDAQGSADSADSETDQPVE